MTARAMAVTLDDIHRARGTIAGRIHRTPLVHSSALGQQTGTHLFLKAENLQKTGSFKPRGAVNKVKHLSDSERARGLITISAGNHAQALAYAAAAEGIHCVVVMPNYASHSKIAASRGYGAEVVVHGDVNEAFEKLHELQRTHGFTLVHPYDDPLVIAGQGTVGLEVLEECPDVEVVVVPIGGGGLISGVATAIKSSRATTQVIGVEPYGAPTMSEALRHNAPTRLPSVQTIADGLTAPIAGELTLPIVQRFVDDVILVTDDEIAHAVRTILERTKLLAEPAGAAALAALLSGRLRLRAGTRVAAILSGGNVDQSRLKELL